MQPDLWPEVTTSFLTRLDIDAQAPVDLGQTPHGWRRIVEIRGGRFDGPALSGDILPSGQDAAHVRPDGVFEIKVGLVLKTHDGCLVQATYRGLWHTTRQSLAAVVRHEIPLDPNDSRIRTAVFFATSSERYAWLNRTIAIGVGRPKMIPGNAGIWYDLFAVA